MSKPSLHFYGKNFGDIHAIYHVLRDTGRYDITYNWYKLNGVSTGNQSDRQPEEVDFVITSSAPTVLGRSKEIHVGHGLGPIAKIYSPTVHHFAKDAYGNGQYYAITLYGELQKQDYVDFGYPEDKAMVVGAPVSVLLSEPVDEAHRSAWFSSHGLDPNKKTALYAPTWDQDSKRGFFVDWSEDGQERQRVDYLCDYITNLNMNFIVRFHESTRYSSDWREVYSDIFARHNVHFVYLEESSSNIPYLKYSDIMIGDQSSCNTDFYIQDKPVIHLGRNAFSEKRSKGHCGWRIDDRPGHIADSFPELILHLADSVAEPERFSAARQAMVNKYVSFTGDAARQAIVDEFERIVG